jgi:DNA-binding transcriptional ArsR family regulator
MTLTKAEMFKTLGVENRIRIIDLLKSAGPLGVNELSQALEITPSAVSQHLKILRHAGLVRSERKGYWVPYKVNEEALEQCGELLSEVCTCGCKETGLVRQGELEAATDKLALLKSWERELQRELREVRCRMEELAKNER